MPVVLASLGLMLAGRATAQTLTNLHSFTALIGYTNSDGAYPQAGLILSSNTLYGTAGGGGSSGNGTVFAVSTSGMGFTNLHTFTAQSYDSAIGFYTNSDGVAPIGLILSGNTLYGTANNGGSSGNGAVFAVNTDGTAFTNLYSFTATLGPNSTNSDGAYLDGALTLSSNIMYGTASTGGSSGNGTVFAVNAIGTGFTNLHSFTALVSSTNSDGDFPAAALILSSNTLYGTAAEGGSSGNGTVFAVNTDGTGFTNLYSFTATLGSKRTNSDGAYPYAALILSSNTLYGTAAEGGSSGNGTVFAVNTDGTGFTNLHSFTALKHDTNSDGAYPYAALILSSNTLYGTAAQGGSSGNGTVFAVNTDGTGFMTLYSFTATDPNTGTNTDGAYPQAGLILSSNTLYGTVGGGGSSGNGTVFGLSLGSVTVSPPQLTIIPSGANVILTWPTNATGFTLQSTTNLDSLAVWTTNSPPVVVNGQNTVTNPISGTQKFFRLSQ
jgi:uncharacterized repeat protein (TIGR03803 family)